MDGEPKKSSSRMVFGVDASSLSNPGGYPCKDSRTECLMKATRTLSVRDMRACWSFSASVVLVCLELVKATCNSSTTSLAWSSTSSKYCLAA